eukprot:CAMPEP_0114415012 /NCGR_PEP_ID=MMETSP0103-20121206/1690_1 /TAXON_ID=37642 ORGANISM="Paraphysomonas imperforata, Strain PA2" /NCGR_SAMPLE_ID=MMETSP0103 /ASSEMBLY_ACC=CAM_ASM_000201 /LENGTH=646 /DNA_ID=CAMNT_0001583183 /DNA_START=137 /DNA_END=2077 /DNA_ORIENTATION=-
MPSSFRVPDEYGVKGGIEYGFMSCSLDKNIAYQYSNAEDKVDAFSTVFEIEEGMIDRGADVSWLSQFPQEKEVVFPPLTSLQVYKEPELIENGLLSVKLRANINLRLQTFDEVINKAKSNTIDIMDYYIDDVKNYSFNFSENPNWYFDNWYGELVDFREELKCMDGQGFNHQHTYRRIIDHSLNLKGGVVKKIQVLRVLLSIDKSTVENVIAFDDTICRLKVQSAADFASEAFCADYVKHDVPASDNEDCVLSNYPLLWSLPLKAGSWTKIIHSMGAIIPPVKVWENHNWVQHVRRKFITNKYVVKFIFDPILQPFFGNALVESLLGYNGTYYFLGSNGVSQTAIYQLIRENMALSPVYVYKFASRWFVGPTVNSTVAYLRSNAIFPSDEVGQVCPENITWESIHQSKSNFERNTLVVPSSLDPTRDIEHGQGDPVNRSKRKSSFILISKKPNDSKSFDLKSSVYQQKALLCRLTEEGGKYGIGKILEYELESIEIFCEQMQLQMPMELQERLGLLGVKKNLQLTTQYNMLVYFTISITFTIFAFVLLLAVFVSLRVEKWAWFLRGYAFFLCHMLICAASIVSLMALESRVAMASLIFASCSLSLLVALVAYVVTEFGENTNVYLYGLLVFLAVLLYMESLMRKSY